jgi:peroxiredoxin
MFSKEAPSPIHFAFFAKWVGKHKTQPSSFSGVVMSLTESTMLELGTTAPDFELTDTITGKTVRRNDFRGSKALLVMFICTHCPYVKHIEQGLAALGADYAGKSLAIAAISSNDVTTHPADSPAGMKQQAEAFGFNFPYLYDESQAVAHAYKAACTPDFFLFDSDFKLVYRGEFDRSRPGNGVKVTGEDLRAAIDAALAGKPPLADQRPSIGCNIKWKA